MAHTSNSHPPPLMDKQLVNLGRRFIGAVDDQWDMYSDNPADYVIGEPIGFGASSVVYGATFHPPSGRPAIPCALKVLDLDVLPLPSFLLLRRETQLMSLSKHPNVLRVRGSWTKEHKLYIAMRLMSKGSVADIMHYGWPGGLEEDVVRCILKQALEGLNYLHINGFIHRDVKAANLLVDDDGTVLLGDLGVAASLTEELPSFKQNTRSHKLGKRKSFVGTPCWMAPELIQGRSYDASADIWSFGILALELAQGRPPRARETSQKVLLQIVKDAPPSLDRRGNAHKYSRAFQEFVESCLTKDPSARPSAEALLNTPFLRGAKKKSFLIPAILSNLPPLQSRQQRRLYQPQMSVQSRRSVASWDFSASASVTLHGGQARGISARSSVVSLNDGLAELGIIQPSVIESDIDSYHNNIVVVEDAAKDDDDPAAPVMSTLEMHQKEVPADDHHTFHTDDTDTTSSSSEALSVVISDTEDAVAVLPSAGTSPAASQPIPIARSTSARYDVPVSSGGGRGKPRSGSEVTSSSPTSGKFSGFWKKLGRRDSSNDPNQSSGSFKVMRPSNVRSSSIAQGNKHSI